MWSLALCLGLALADPGSVEGAPSETPPVATGPQRLEDVWATLPASAVLDEAVTRREQGDWAGAEARLRSLQARAELAAPVAYQLAVLSEMRERYPEALFAYREVQERYPDTAEAADARFREALVLDDLGRHKEALAALRALHRAERWEGADALSLQIERGVASLGYGRTRRGVRQIQTALDQLEGADEARWMRARGRAALLRVQLNAADAIAIDDPDKAEEAVLERRALITDAEQQRAAIAALGEPEYVLEALLRIGDAAMALYEDVNAAPPPPEIAADPELQAEYTSLVRAESRRFRDVAFQYYDAGVLLAERVRWTGVRALQLRQRRDALSEQMEAELVATLDGG